MTEGKNGVRGLTADEVERSRREHGRNIFTKRARKSFWRVFFGNLGDPVIKVLLLALGLHLVLLVFHDSDWIETVGIAVSVLLATMISTVSEYGSEAAFARLLDSCGAALPKVTTPFSTSTTLTLSLVATRLETVSNFTEFTNPLFAPSHKVLPYKTILIL